MRVGKSGERGGVRDGVRREGRNNSVRNDTLPS